MIRERVGDWRLAWRFALAGLLAGRLVVALTTRGVMNGPFFAAQDQLSRRRLPIAASRSSRWTSRPEPRPLALRCAYDLIAQAPTLQAKLVEHGLPPVSWGMDINTGPAVVGKHGKQGSPAVHSARGHRQHCGALLQCGSRVQHPRRLANI